MLQALVDLTPAGGTLDLTGQSFTVPHGTRIVVPRPMTIVGGTVTVDSNAVPTCSLFDLSGLPNGSRAEFRDVTIHGPDTTGWASGTENPHGAIFWSLARTWDSTLLVDGCTVTGGYGYAVQRSGGGRFEVHGSVLSGWVGALAFFEGHGGHGSMLVRNCALSAPANSKSSSIGAYIHPHLDVTWDDVACSGWNRWAAYMNGTPQSAGHHTFVDVTATDCSLIQTGSSSETTLVRCVEQGIPKNGGSFFKGPMLSIGSRWAGAGMIGFLNTNSPDRRFVRDTIATPRTWLAGGNGTMGSVLLNDCTVELADKTQVVKLVPTSTVAVRVVSTAHTGSGSQFAYNIEGGTLRFVDTVPPARVRVVAPGVLV